jgi:AcrR family transcriptional regulator
MFKVADAGVRQSVEETRQRILLATREIFAQKGSRATTTREVADRAEVNEATLFRHFGTKQQLLQAMLDQFCLPKEGELSFVDQLHGPIEEQLRQICRAGIARITEKRDLICVSLMEDSLNPDAGSPVWRAPQVAQRKLADFMRQRIEAGELQGDPDDLARAFMCLMFAYVISPRIWPNAPDDRERVVELFVEIFLNGARGT